MKPKCGAVFFNLRARRLVFLVWVGSLSNPRLPGCLVILQKLPLPMTAVESATIPFSERCRWAILLDELSQRLPRFQPALARVCVVPEQVADQDEMMYSSKGGRMLVVLCRAAFKTPAALFPRLRRRSTALWAVIRHRWISIETDRMDRIRRRVGASSHARKLPRTPVVPAGWINYGTATARTRTGIDAS
jgi:hypothetical protein